MKPEPRPGPPGWLEALLRLLVPSELTAEIGGDLEEAWQDLRDERGSALAGLWYVGQLLQMRPFRLAREARRLRSSTSPTWSRAEPMDRMQQDVRLALRRLVATPGFTLVAVLSLALGIGANTAVFSLLDRMLGYQPAVGDPESLVDIYQNYRGRPYWALSLDHYESIRELDAFSGATAYVYFETRLEPEPGRDVRAYAELVAGDYFGTLGVAMAVGRNFTEEELAEDAGIPVVILDHEIWRRLFQADPSVVGHTVRINALAYTVVGVAAEGFDGKALPLLRTDMYVPYGMNAYLRKNERTSSNLSMSARLAPGVTAPRAQAELDALAQRWREREQYSDAFMGFVAYRRGDVLFHPGLDGPMVPMAGLLLTGVGLVLLLACTNLAGFLLARAADRRKEFAVRMAMGASRGRIVGQLLMESVPLALLGGAAGLAVGRLTLDLLLSIQPPFPLPLDVTVPLNWNVLGFTLGVSLLAGVLFGLAPAWQASRAEVAGTLRDESAGGGGGRGKVGLRGALVAGQVAISLVLLAGAGLFVRSMVAASTVDPGFDPELVAVVSISPEMSGYDAQGARGLMGELLLRAADVPDVEVAAIGSRLPLQLGNWTSRVRIPGAEEWRYLEVASISPAYLEAMGIELLQGRAFRPEDDDGPSVVILNQAAAERLFDGEAAVGRTLDVAWAEDDAVVVGVTRTTKVKTLGEAPYPYLFRPLGQQGTDGFWLLARVRRSPAAAAEALGRLAKSVDPDLFVQDPGTAARTLALQLYLPRMGASLLGALGALALALAAVGLYGLVSYAAVRREKEVGIRVSLGAGRRDVVRLVMGSGLRLVLAGTAAGMVLSLLSARLLGRFLFGIGSLDPLTFLAVPLLLVGVASMASWLPARRVARVDPMRALRSE